MVSDEMKKKVVSVLKEMGITERQTEIYLFALEKGPLNVSDLARHLLLHRQQIYREIDELKALGLLEGTRAERQKILAANPTRLTTLANKRVEETRLLEEKIAKLVPELREAVGGQPSGLTTRYFEGRKGLEEAYEKELAACVETEVLSLAGDLNTIYEDFSEEYWDKWNKKFHRQRSASKMIVAYSPAALRAARNDAKYGRETRYIQGFTLKTNIDIFGANVLMVSFADEAAVWIESPMLAQSYRALFAALWVTAKKIESSV